jgi:Skp family chaperone for outer membrane proteins
MPADKHAQEELKDLNHKLQNAKDEAETHDPSKREKADLKLLEQEVAAGKLKAKHPAAKTPKAESEVDAKLDKALKDSFPGSDPVSFVEAAPITKHDRKLSTVLDEDDTKK